MKLIVDASVALGIATNQVAPEQLRSHRLVAPPLMWSEALSVLHVGLWTKRVESEDAEAARSLLERVPVALRSPRGLHKEAWQIAEELGVAKTYDAEYLALARIEGGKVIAVDARMRRGADRLGLVVLPTEL